MLPGLDIATLLLCDECPQLGLIHASLADTRLITTPTLLSILVRTGDLAAADARVLLDEISDVRSWRSNSYVQRARSLLEEPPTGVFERTPCPTEREDGNTHEGTY